MISPNFHGPVLECQKALGMLGIDNVILEDVLTVDRTSCVLACPGLLEWEAYDTVLSLLRDHFPNWYVYFSGKTDNWFCIDFHPK